MPVRIASLLLAAGGLACVACYDLDRSGEGDAYRLNRVTGEVCTFREIPRHRLSVASPGVVTLAELRAALETSKRLRELAEEGKSEAELRAEWAAAAAGGAFGSIERRPTAYLTEIGCDGGWASGADSEFVGP